MKRNHFEWVERLPIATNYPVAGYAFAIAATLGSLLVRLDVGSLMPHGYPFVTFFPVVTVTAFVFGVRPGLFSAVLGWLAARYYLIDPVYSLGFGPQVWGAFAFYVIIVLTNIVVIHFMQRANRELRSQRELARLRQNQRETMFHELQHRISNKLQIIASLLTLQRRTVVDPDAQKALGDAARRVGVIGRISRSLHNPDQDGVGVASMLQQIGTDVIEASGAPDVTLTVDADPALTLDHDAAVPIALIVCESISNALEHGFQSRGRGHIDIAVRRTDPDRVVVTIADNGLGVPVGFDAGETNSLGLKIATTLARQLHGGYILHRSGERGSVAELTARA